MAPTDGWWLMAMSCSATGETLLAGSGRREARRYGCSVTTRVVVLVSGSGTLLQALLDAGSAGEVDARVVAVG